jgi:alanine dehydrogenase
MPGAVPRTSTFALSNQTIAYVNGLANEGWDAVRKDPALLLGLNTYRGLVTHPALAKSLGLKYTPAMNALAA